MYLANRNLILGQGIKGPEVKATCFIIIIIKVGVWGTHDTTDSVFTLSLFKIKIFSRPK